jgi:hypothetical protein
MVCGDPCLALVTLVMILFEASLRFQRACGRVSYGPFYSPISFRNSAGRYHSRDSCRNTHGASNVTDDYYLELHPLHRYERLC